MLFDTDILIAVLRGNQRAIRAIDAAPDRSISQINALELLQGPQSKIEQNLVKKFLKNFFLEPLNADIGYRAQDLIEKYALSHGLELADALIAATALERNLVLCTANSKHFKPIVDLQLTIISFK